MLYQLISTYDERGWLTLQITGTPTDGAGRLATETGPLGSTAEITYSYDQLGRVTGTAINSVSSSVTYDSLGRITGATNPLGTFTYGYYGITPRLHTISNDQNGLNTSYSYQSGTGSDFRLTDISNYSTGTTVLSKHDYTYTTEGTIATWQEQIDSATPTVWTYQYDKADQLTGATRTNTSTSAVLSQYVYGYDLAGNRTSEQIGFGVTSTTVNNLNQITGTGAGGSMVFSGTLSKPSTVTVGGNVATPGNNYSTNFAGSTSVTTGTNTVAVVAADVNGNVATNNYQVVVPSGTSITPTYDLDGNLTDNGNGQTYSWDAKNELTKITYASGATTEFTYDGRERRVKIVEKNSSSTVTSTKQLVWLGDEIAEERDASDTVTKRYYAQGMQVPGATSPLDKLYYTRDHLGSVREMVDHGGTLQARYDYDPYGRVTKVSGSLDSDFQYAGMYVHAISGLNLTLYRAYNPNTAKWLSRDPLEDVEMSQGPNLYQYTFNNSIRYTDPVGKSVYVVIGLGLLVLTLGITLYWFDQLNKAAEDNAKKMRQNEDNTVNPNVDQQSAANALATNTCNAPNPALLGPAVNALTSTPGSLLTGPAGPGKGAADTLLSIVNTLLQILINPPITPTVPGLPPGPPPPPLVYPHSKRGTQPQP